MNPPFRSVLCPTDLSPLGNLAAKVAYLLADRGATVWLVHVDAPPNTGNPLYPDERPPGAPTPAQVEAAREDRRARLRALVPPDAAARGIRSEVEIVEGEDPALEIEGAARRLRAETIVLSSHGRWGLGRLVHGESVAMRLLHERDLDVIVVHTDKA